MLEMGTTLPEMGRESINQELINIFKGRVINLISEVTEITAGFVEGALDSEKKNIIYQFIDMRNGKLSLLAGEIWCLVSITNLKPQENEDKWHQSDYYGYNLELRNMHNTLISKRLELKHLLGDENPDLLSSAHNS